MQLPAPIFSPNLKNKRKPTSKWNLSQSSKKKIPPPAPPPLPPEKKTSQNFSLLTLDKFLQEKLDAWTTYIIYGIMLKYVVLWFATLSKTQSVRPQLVPSLCSISVTFGTPYHVIVHQVLPTQPSLEKQRISLKVASILMMCLWPCSYFTYNQFNE